MTAQEAKIQIESIPSKIWEQLSPSDNEAIEIAIEALEKQIPKRPHKYIAFDGIERNGCPRCFEERNRNEILYAGQKFCSVCGQKLE